VLECSHVPASCPLPGSHLHFVLCDFGKNGRAFVETDPAYADRNTIISNLIAGEYERPLNVIAFNLAEGWACDVSESIAKAIMKGGAVLTDGTTAFVAAHLVEAARSK
jgi:hypothetical protein